MTGRNQKRDALHLYTAISSATVEMYPSGIFYENTSWVNFVFDNQPVQLDQPSLNFRERISLDPRFNQLEHYPDQTYIDRRLCGPADDLLNIYIDIQLAAMFPMLQKAGDNFFFKFGKPISFLKGQAENCLDFDLKLKQVNHETGIAILEVKHIPPKDACGIKLPAEWMNAPVLPGLLNNIVSTEPLSDGSFSIVVGSNTIIVEATIQLGSGKILNATLSDQYQLIERICTDSKGVNCNEPVRYKEQRDITIVPKGSDVHE